MVESVCVEVFCGTHAQSCMSGISSLRKKFSSSASSCSSTGIMGSLLFAAVFALACAGVILSKANLDLLVAP